ncbi:hypothetical protein BGW39_010935 [Mortierella sp. 14UC]|nr:hypothetical protein BGW39_010935 [Mortierella sp. 14UC]
MSAVPVHTPSPSFVPQQYYSPEQQQQHYGQTNDWGRDPTLSPLAQDLGFGGNGNNLSDLDNSPVLSGYGADELSELLNSDDGYNFVFNNSSDNNAFNFINSLVGNNHHHHNNHNNVVSAPPPPTPATTIVATPQLDPYSPLPMTTATSGGMHFHVSSPTPTPLSPPCVPYSPSVPFLIPSNLFQYTLPPSCSMSSSSLSSSSGSGTGSISSPIVKPSPASSSSSMAAQKSTLKAKSGKRITRPTPAPVLASSCSSSSTVATAAATRTTTTTTTSSSVISSIAYFDHNNEKRFRCAWPGCAQDFERHHNCKAHYSTHTGERHFKCSDPGCQSKSFRQKGDLTRHMRIHTKERPYACAGARIGCGMAYGRCDQKAKHEKKCPHVLALGGL